MTDHFQPVDAGVGANLKRLISQALDDRLVNDTQLFEDWTSGKWTAKRQRILLTSLVADAFETLSSSGFAKYFARTGCLH